MSIQNLTNGVSITCHAWNGDRSRIAICPNNNQVIIMRNDGKTWVREHTLSQHDSVVTGIDWAPKTNRIVTCSQDRNAYVWNFQEDGTWKPELVILRIDRAATDVKWSPNEDKFAVASGAKVVSVCHFEEDNDWWVSKHIKKHRSTIVKVAWHPNNQLLATASTDYKARVVYAMIREVDRKPAPTNWGAGKVFGDILGEFDCSGWVESVAFSPSGNRLCYVGHNSTITFVEAARDGKHAVSTLKLRQLPMCDCLFVDENRVVAAGHDCKPFLFSAAAPGAWELTKCIDEKKAAAAGGASATVNKFEMFRNKVDKGTTDQSALATTVDSKHQNTITCIRPFTVAGGVVSEFTTSALEGAVAWWKI